MINLGFSLFIVHATVNLGYLAGVAHAFQPADEVIERVAVLREDDELLIRPARVGQHADERPFLDLKMDAVLARGDVHAGGVRDAGRGFVPAAGARGESFGLVNMRERVEALGGTFRLNSAPGAGTTVEARVPLAREGK